MENTAVAILILIVIMFMFWYMSVDDELDRLREMQRLDDIEDAEREELLGDLQYRQDKYDRWRYWSGPHWRRYGWGRRGWRRPYNYRYWKPKGKK